MIVYHDNGNIKEKGDRLPSVLDQKENGTLAVF